MANDIIAPARATRPMQIKNLVPSLPERGHVKIGRKGKMVKSRNGNEFQPPEKLDHFLITTMQRGADNNFLLDEAAHEALGPKPTSIPVRLLYDDPSLNFPTRYACYKGRQLWCSGDGEQALRVIDSPKAGAPSHEAVTCPCFRQNPEYAGKDKCKMNGALSVLLEGAGGLGGVWKFRTTSYNSIVGLLSTMAFIRSVTGGPLAGIPFNLIVGAKQAVNPVDGTAVTVYIVGLEYDGDVPQLQQVGHTIALDRARTHMSIAHIEDEARRMLALPAPAGAVLPGDDAADIVEEFYPEQVRGDPPPRPTRQQIAARMAAEDTATTHDPDTGEIIGDDSQGFADDTMPALGARPAAAEPETVGELLDQLPQIDTLRNAAGEAAARGVAALREFGMTLAAPDIAALKPHMDELWMTARAADTAAATPGQPSDAHDDPAISGAAPTTLKGWAAYADGCIRYLREAATLDDLQARWGAQRLIHVDAMHAGAPAQHQKVTAAMTARTAELQEPAG